MSPAKPTTSKPKTLEEYKASADELRYCYDQKKQKVIELQTECEGLREALRQRDADIRALRSERDVKL